MYIVLTRTDLDRLSPQTRSELLHVFFGAGTSGEDDFLPDGGDSHDSPEWQGPGVDSWEPASEMPDSFGESRVVVEISAEQANGLIANLSAKSIDTLKRFASTNHVLVDSLVGEGQIYENFADLKRSFVGAVNRRLRTVTRNRSAVLFRKIETGDGVGIAVKEQTAIALHNVFFPEGTEAPDAS